MAMMKCIIIDDEPVAVDILADYVQRIPFLELSGTYRNAFRALEFLKMESTDIIFLDIDMPDLSGIQFLKVLDRKPMVVFTTAHSEYALESYDYEAVDYLLKPIEFERFLKAARRALSRFESDVGMSGSRDDSIMIKSGTDFHRVVVDEILYIKAAGNYVIFVTEDDEIMALMTMTEALTIMTGHRFYRVHRSYLIHFQNVDKIERDRVVIRGRGIPIGESYRESFFRSIESS